MLSSPFTPVPSRRRMSVSTSLLREKGELLFSSLQVGNPKAGIQESSLTPPASPY